MIDSKNNGLFPNSSNRTLFLMGRERKYRSTHNKRWRSNQQQPGLFARIRNQLLTIYFLTHTTVKAEGWAKKLSYFLPTLALIWTQQILTKHLETMQYVSRFPHSDTLILEHVIIICDTYHISFLRKINIYLLNPSHYVNQSLLMACQWAIVCPRISFPTFPC